MDDFKIKAGLIQDFLLHAHNKTIIALDKKTISCEILIITAIDYYYERGFYEYSSRQF